MDFEGRQIGFQEAERRYAELKRQLDAGIISDEVFDAWLKQLMVQDDEGRWWAKSRNTGTWHYHNGSAWVRDTPPTHQRPQTLPGEDTPDHRPQLEQGEGLPPSEKTVLGSVPTPDENGGKKHRGVSRWVFIGAGLAGLATLAGIGIIVNMSGGEGPAGPAPGYALFAHESGALSVEVPSEWDERVVVDSEGEKGRSSWSSFLGEGESVGPSLTAVNDLSSWRSGTPEHQGVYMVASKKLAQEYSEDELVASGPNDYSKSCEAGSVEDFERSPYTGKKLEWKNCGGDSEHTAVTLAAAPKGRECVVVAQVGGYLQGEEEKVQHVLDTFKVDCDKID